MTKRLVLKFQQMDNEISNLH